MYENDILIPRISFKKIKRTRPTLPAANKAQLLNLTDMKSINIKFELPFRSSERKMFTIAVSLKRPIISERKEYKMNPIYIAVGHFIHPTGLWNPTVFYILYTLWRARMARCILYTLMAVHDVISIFPRIYNQEKNYILYHYMMEYQTGFSTWNTKKNEIQFSYRTWTLCI